MASTMLSLSSTLGLIVCAIDRRENGLGGTNDTGQRDRTAQEVGHLHSANRIAHCMESINHKARQEGHIEGYSGGCSALPAVG